MSLQHISKNRSDLDLFNLRIELGVEEMLYHLLNDERECLYVIDNSYSKACSSYDLITNFHPNQIVRLFCSVLEQLYPVEPCWVYNYNIIHLKT